MNVIVTGYIFGNDIGLLKPAGKAAYTRKPPAKQTKKMYSSFSSGDGWCHYSAPQESPTGWIAEGLWAIFSTFIAGEHTLNLELLRHSLATLPHWYIHLVKRYIFPYRQTYRRLKMNIRFHLQNEFFQKMFFNYILFSYIFSLFSVTFALFALRYF